MKGAGALSRRSIRRLFLFLALVGTLVLLWLSRPAQAGPKFGSAGSHDFVQYWAAAQVLLDGGDPYDAEALLAVEKSVGWPESEPLLLWNPPWTLTLVLPLAFLPFGLAAQVWLVIQIGLLLASSVLLWRTFATADNRVWLALVLSAGFAPGLLALLLGQVSIWLLVGVAAFLWAVQGRRDLLAGVALALLTIKPHVAYLVLLAALWWVWRTRRWSVVSGVVAALGAATLPALILSNQVLSHYLHIAVRPPLQDFAPPTIGLWLRTLLRVDWYWLQYLPSLVGGMCLLTWLLRRQGPWDWNHTAPPLLLASVITAAYGWSYDLVVLLPAVLALAIALRPASRARQVSILGTWVLAQVALLLQTWAGLHDSLSVWYAPLLAGLYGFEVLSARRSETQQPGAIT